MTIEEARKLYGKEKDGYVSCYGCPVHSCCTMQSATGFADCWKYIAEHLDNPYWERINAIAEHQRAKGMSKYGVGLESNPAAILERIEHLQEELIDGLMYCEWIKDHLTELEG